MAKPITNHDLDALLLSAGYDRQHAAFARQVNAAGRDRDGLHLRYGAASVYWWLRGRTPEPGIPALIAAVLSRRLGRPVSPDELGFDDRLTDVGLRWPPTNDAAISTVSTLWRYVVLRREFLNGVPFAETAASEAGWRWHFDPTDRTAARIGDRTVTLADVAALGAIQTRFLDLDRRHGGGPSTGFLAEFLHREVTPMLHGTYPDSVGRHLMSAAAALTTQLAFMSYDSGAHGLAQRAFIQALRLAKAGNDTAFGCHVLANMSTQAVFLGRRTEAIQLARAAVAGATRHTPGAAMARLHTAAACAYSVSGDARATRDALRAAERSLGRAAPPRPDWADYFTPAHFAGTAVRCFSELGRPTEALSYADTALQIGAAGARTRALHAALIATVHGEAGNIDQACELGEQAIHTARQVRSHRVDVRLHALTTALGPHHRHRRAKALIAATRPNRGRGVV
jgi:hypothetical protein